MRAANMQSLTDDIKADHPGVVIYGIGDEAHQTHPSGHNEDDTPGSLPEMQDADTKPEHRSIDVMLGSAFTKAEAYALITYVLARPDLLKRLIYIIFDSWIWSKSRGWVKREFDGDPHDDHIHFSGDAADDDNADPWLSGGNMFCKKGDRSESVRRLQLLLNEVTAGRTSVVPLVADGFYGDTTAARVYAVCSGPKDGAAFNGTLAARLDRALFVAWLAGAIADGTIPKGVQGIQGVKGDPGQDGVVPDGAVFVMQAPPPAES